MKTIRPYQTSYPEKQFGKPLFLRILVCAALLFVIHQSVGTPLQAQVRATGHVFAEIVEPAALSATARNNHSIQPAENSRNDELVIARVKLSNGANVNVDVAVQTSRLEAANGQTLMFDAFACDECSEETLQSFAADKVFTLKATPGEPPGMKKTIPTKAVTA